MQLHDSRVRFLSLVACVGFVLNACDSASSPTDNVEVGATGAATALDDEYCSLTQQFEAVGECERFNRQYESLDAGIDAFKPDEKMVREKPKIVRYAIQRLPKEIQGENGEIATPDPSPGVTASPVGTDAAVGKTDIKALTQEEIDARVKETKADVAAAIVPDAAIEAVLTGTVKIARLMYACLEGDPIFKIEPAACQTLDTLEQPEPVWQWTLTATEQGNDFELRLRSGIEVTASDGSTRRIGEPVRRAEIDVDVDGPGKVRDMFDRLAEWLGTPLGVIAALTTLLIALAGLRAAWKRFTRGEGGNPG